MKRLSFFLLFMSVLAGLLAGCRSGEGETQVHDLRMAPLEGTPIEVQQAPAVVRQAYQFAAANSEIMTQIPCYCGCGAVGHTSNYACYVSGTDASGLVQYDLHALGCSLCVDITLDVMRMLRQGKVTAEMRAFIDATYAQYGPSNMP